MYVVPHVSMNWKPLQVQDLEFLSERDRPMLIMFQTSILDPDHKIVETPAFRTFAHESSLDLRIANVGWEWDPRTDGTVALCERIEKQFNIDDYSAALPSFIICIPGSDDLHIASVSHTIEELIEVITNSGEGIRRPQYLPSTGR